MLIMRTLRSVAANAGCCSAHWQRFRSLPWCNAPLGQPARRP